jgi:ATP synthase protein I
MTTPSSHAVARRWTLVAGLACSLAGWAAAGTEGLAGGLVATAIVVAFLTSGLIPIKVTQGVEVRAGLGLAVLLLTYTLRLALALMALALISRAGFADTRWLGVTIIACALTWSAVHVAHSVRASRREPTIVPESSVSRPDGTGN